MAPSAEIQNLLQDLTSEDTQSNALENPVPVKKTSAGQFGTVESGVSAKGRNQPLKPSYTPFSPNKSVPNTYYPAHSGPSPAYYGSYYGAGNEWNDYASYMNTQGVGMYPVVYDENGSVMFPDGYGYWPYGPYLPAASPVPTESQLNGPKHYQNLAPTTSQGEPCTSVAPDQKPLPVDSGKKDYAGIVNGTKGNDRQNESSGVASFSRINGTPSKNSSYYQNSNFTGLQLGGPISGLGMYPNEFYNPYWDAYWSYMGFGSGGYDFGMKGYGWSPVNGKYKSKGHGNNYFGFRSENIDGLDELNRGPRMNHLLEKGFAPKGQNEPSTGTITEEKGEISAILDLEKYNKADFPEEYTEAKFFIIKSYSEDDIHKSIKYNVWASTPNGNKKLDAAYKEAQQKSCSCPVFLFFSVNTSGQFVGLAEMIGSVNFDKSVEYWQQDKWTGCFPVKWHIVKDVPNSLLKHITLENNENKSVTNSRDTQEVKLEQGIKMVKIFKEHNRKTCILDDFGFYEKRQTMIQEKKAKQQQFQKQVLEDKSIDDKKELVNGSYESPEVVSEVIKESSPVVESSEVVKESSPVVESSEVVEESSPVVKSNKVVEESSPVVESNEVIEESSPVVESNEVIKEYNGELKHLENGSVGKTAERNTENGIVNGEIKHLENGSVGKTAERITEIEIGNGEFNHLENGSDGKTAEPISEDGSANGC